MGLQLTLSSSNNHLNYEFKDAYWAISDIRYDTKNCFFKLKAYPSRDAKLQQLSLLPKSSLPVGSAVRTAIDCVLYGWEGIFPIEDMFPSGIPLDENAQKTRIYNVIKYYTELPFMDVFEEESTTENS